jgi:hypothetical protein
VDQLTRDLAQATKDLNKVNVRAKEDRIRSLEDPPPDLTDGISVDSIPVEADRAAISLTQSTYS